MDILTAYNITAPIRTVEKTIKINGQSYDASYIQDAIHDMTFEHFQDVFKPLIESGDVQLLINAIDDYLERINE